MEPELVSPRARNNLFSSCKARTASFQGVCTATLDTTRTPAAIAIRKFKNTRILPTMFMIYPPRSVIHRKMPYAVPESHIEIRLISVASVHLMGRCGVCRLKIILSTEVFTSEGETGRFLQLHLHQYGNSGCLG